MESTDLNQVKRIAKYLLRVRIGITPYSPAIVQHPFTSTGVTFIPDTNEMIIITGNDANLTRWQNYMDKRIDKAKNVYAIYAMVNKPYALTFIKYVKDALADNEMAELLADAWVNSECPNMDVDVSKTELVEMFTKADKQYLMSEVERKQLAQLGDKVTVYRGVTSYNAKNVRALSWTTDKEKAKWFAHRFKENGIVYTAQIRKAQILAVFASRGESEIVLNPKGLMQLKKVEG